jgi:hypothetical protein
LVTYFSNLPPWFWLYPLDGGPVDPALRSIPPPYGDDNRKNAVLPEIGTVNMSTPLVKTGDPGTGTQLAGARLLLDRSV